LYASDFNAESENLRGFQTFHKGIDYDNEYQKIKENDAGTSARDDSSFSKCANSADSTTFFMEPGMSKPSCSTRTLQAVPLQAVPRLPLSNLFQTSYIHSGETGLLYFVLTFLVHYCQLIGFYLAKGIQHGWTSSIKYTTQ
jgi:hypothetical protein